MNTLELKDLRHRIIRGLPYDASQVPELLEHLEDACNEMNCEPEDLEGACENANDPRYDDDDEEDGDSKVDSDDVGEAREKLDAILKDVELALACAPSGDSKPSKKKAAAAASPIVAAALERIREAAREAKESLSE